MRSATICLAVLLLLGAPAHAQTEEELTAQRMYVIAYRGTGGSGEIPTQFTRTGEGKVAVLLGAVQGYGIKLEGNRLTFKFDNDKGGRKRTIDTVLDRRPDGTWVGFMIGPSSRDPNQKFQDIVEMRPLK